MATKEGRRRDGLRPSPAPELDAWLAESEERMRRRQAEGRPGRRKRLLEILMERYEKVKVPKEVREAMDGLMAGLVLKMWWVTPNEWMWPNVDDSGFYDEKGIQRVSPEKLWGLGQEDDVLDLILALKGDLGNLAPSAQAEERSVKRVVRRRK